MIEPLDESTFMRLMEKSEKMSGHSSRAIERFYDWMYGDIDGLVQVCAFPVPGEGMDRDNMGPGKWIHARTKEEFTNFCTTHSNVWRYHIYSGINTLDREPEKGRGAIEHIDRVNTISLDIETERDSYSGSSKEEVWWSYKYGLAQAKFMMEEYGVCPMIVMSENGIHLHFRANIKVLDDLVEGKQHLYAKYITKQAQASKYAQVIREKVPDGINFAQDDVSDVPRVMKVPGTMGIKSETGRMCGIIHEPDKEEAGVIYGDQINISEEEREELENDESGDPVEVRLGDSEDVEDSKLRRRIEKLKKNDRTFREFYEGSINIGGEANHSYDSRSEAEFAFVMKLLNHGFKPEEIVKVMWKSAMTKWGEEGEHYRKRTIEEALDRFDGNVTKDSTNGSFSFSKEPSDDL